MRVTHSVRYDASVADVRAMLADAAFREKAAWALGSTSVEVHLTGDSLRIDLESPNTDVPAFARKLVGDSVHAIQAEEWSGEDAELSITTPKVPAGIQGRRTLVADGDGCLDTFDGEAKARIPVVGGKLEKLIADKLKEGWDVEHGVGVVWLDGER